MHINFVVVLGHGGDKQAGGERTAEAVDKHIRLLALEFGEGFVNRRAVEVETSDVALKRYVIRDIRHGKTNFATTLPL